MTNFGLFQRGPERAFRRHPTAMFLRPRTGPARCRAEARPAAVSDTRCQPTNGVAARFSGIREPIRD